MIREVYRQDEKRWDKWEQKFLQNNPDCIKVHIEINTAKVRTDINKPLNTTERRKLRKQIGIKHDPDYS